MKTMLEKLVLAGEAGILQPKEVSALAPYLRENQPEDKLPKRLREAWSRYQLFVAKPATRTLH
jgi:hypothetical protein